jgi:hypothetical protein
LLVFWQPNIPAPICWVVFANPTYSLCKFILRFNPFEMHEFDPDGAGDAHQNISVIDEQAGQSAGIVFHRIAKARSDGKGSGEAGNQISQKTQDGRRQRVRAGRFGAFGKPVGDQECGNSADHNKIPWVRSMTGTVANCFPVLKRNVRIRLFGASGSSP